MLVDLAVDGIVEAGTLEPGVGTAPENRARVTPGRSWFREPHQGQKSFQIRLKKRARLSQCAEKLPLAVGLSGLSGLSGCLSEPWRGAPGPSLRYSAPPPWTPWGRPPTGRHAGGFTPCDTSDFKVGDALTRRGY